MKKTVGLFLIAAIQAFWITADIPANPLPGCCMLASGWTTPVLGTGTAVAVDMTRKRVYATDQSGGLIKAFNYDGTPVVSFGGSGQVSTTMPFGVAVGPCNYPGVYVVSRSPLPSKVTKFDADGNLVWTSPDLPDGGARYIFVDDYSNSYVTSGYNKIYILNPDGNTAATIIGSGSTTLNAPTGIYLDGVNLYVADSLNDRIIQYTESGINSLNFTPAQAVTITSLSSPVPYGLTKGLDGYFYVTFQNNYGYQIYDSGFNTVGSFCGIPGTLTGAYGVALDETGAIYIASISTNKVIKMQACYIQGPFNACYQGANPPTAGRDFIYPSPAKGDRATVCYSMTGPGQVDIRIWNQNGELAYEVTDRKPAGVQLTSFDLSRFTSGIYYFAVNLTYDSGTSEYLKPKPFAVAK